MEPFVPLSAPVMKGREKDYALQALDDNWISAGPFVQVFEQRLMDWFGKPAIVCSSGTSAIHLALLTLGIGLGDEVVVPDLTFAAPASVVKRVGAHPILVDVDSNGGLNPALIEAALTRNTRAVIPVHLYGVQAQMGRICEIANGHGLHVIEDCCEALPNSPVGRFGCYSFYANKHITTGEGGALVGDTDDLEAAKIFRGGGFIRGGGAYEHRVAGLNHRMTDLQAAVGCAQMERAGHLIDERHAVAKRYGDNLPGFGSWMFVLHPCDPIEVGRYLREKGVETRRVFMPLHQQTPFEQEGDFSVSEELHRTGLCLPTGAHLNDGQVDYIIRVLRDGNYGTD